MRFYEKITRFGLFKRKRGKGGSLKIALSELGKPELSQLIKRSLKGKNVLVTGEFFPTTEEALEEKLRKAKANIMLLLTAETDILICGKYPDWALVEEARKRGIRTIYVDKASELFSAPALETPGAASGFPYRVPLGI